MLFIEIFGEVFIFNVGMIDGGKRVNVFVLFGSNWIAISVIINQVKLVIVIKLFSSIWILFKPPKMKYFPSCRFGSLNFVVDQSRNAAF